VFAAEASRDMTAAAGDNRTELEVRKREALVRWEELLATALGAALAALVLSRLGVAGTIIGAACTPVIITLTSAVISRQIDYARERAASLSPKRPEPGWRRLSERLPRPRRVVVALATAAAAFAVVAVAITVAEAFAGKPMSAWGRSGGSGYTFGGGGGGRQGGAASVSNRTRTTQTGARTITHPTQSATQSTSTTSSTQGTTSTRTTTTTTATTTQTGSTTSSTGTVPQPTQTPPRR
jgi:hypothetical protein